MQLVQEILFEDEEQTENKRLTTMVEDSEYQNDYFDSIPP